MGLFSKKKSEVAQDTNTNLQKIKDDIEEEIEGLESKIKEKNERSVSYTHLTLPTTPYV